MKFSNTTTLDDDWLRGVLRAVTPVGTGDFDAVFKSSSSNSGCASWGGSIDVLLNADTRCIEAAIPMEPPCDPEADALGDVFEAIIEKQFAGYSTH